MNETLWAICNPVEFINAIRFSRRVRDYSPQKIDLPSILNWISQFPEEDRGLILSLLSSIRYYSAGKVKEILVKKNQELLDRLGGAGVMPEHIIYASLDEAGSSSPVMLNVLRDAAQLQRKRTKLIDSRDVFGFVKTTSELGNGAIIYVDDFAGTGKQFLESRNFIAEQVTTIGQFSEFFLLPCICREAYDLIREQGVEVICDYIHEKADRPLHPLSGMDATIKQRLVDYSKRADPAAPLGYGDIAAMVVNYRNSPNSMPPLFRGNVGQDRLKGILPRITDLSR